MTRSPLLFPRRLPWPGRALRLVLASGAAATACLSLLTPHAARSATAQINAAATQQVIRGFGGATVFLPTTPISPADMDTIFGTGPGQIGLTILRVRVPPDDAWRAIELTNARNARARGAIVIATPWSPPAAMKDNNSLVAGALKPSAYRDYATYLNDFARFMAANGAPLYAISVQNEPDIEVTYESCDWTPAQMLEFCRNFAGAITATRVIAPESFQFRRQMSDPILNDEGAAANVDIIGGHIYGAGLSAYPLAAAKGKEVWMTEHLDLSTDWTGALATGREIHDCLATANFSAYIWWYVRRYYGPLGEDGAVTKRGHVMSQFSRFIRPGYVRIDATANPAGSVFVSAYKRDRIVIVAINQGTGSIAQTFSLSGAATSAVTPYVTSSALNQEPQPQIAVAGGTFTATLAAQSITTFVGDLALAAPAIVTAPQGHLVAAGSTLVLEVATTGDYVTYQWNHDGKPLPGATSRLLTIERVTSPDAGGYTVTVVNRAGAVTSPVATIGVATPATPSRLTNLSLRSGVGSGDNVQIAGFIVAGAAPKRVLVRAAGPVLNASFGLAGALPDPGVELRAVGGGSVVAANDDWDAALASTFATAGAFAWTAGSKDAALLATLPPGGYTAIVSDKGAATGIGLVEVYDVDRGTGSLLTNLSARALVGAQDNAQIGGFSITGETARTVVIRVTGPTLRRYYGVSGVLTNPVLELRNQSRPDPVITVERWDAGLSSHFAAVGAAPWPADSTDAALAATLDPGAYTVVVKGRNNGTGVALLEIYAAP